MPRLASHHAFSSHACEIWQKARPRLLLHVYVCTFWELQNLEIACTFWGFSICWDWTVQSEDWMAQSQECTCWVVQSWDCACKRIYGKRLMRSCDWHSYLVALEFPSLQDDSELVHWCIAFRQQDKWTNDHGFSAPAGSATFLCQLCAVGGLSVVVNALVIVMMLSCCLVKQRAAKGTKFGSLDGSL